MLVLTLALLLAAPAVGSALPHHDLMVSLDPATHEIEVHDRLTLPASALESAEPLRFVLHAGLRLREPIPGYRVEALEQLQDG